MPFDLIPTAKGQLTLTRPGQDDVPEVRVRRGFPWSNAERLISIRSKEGKELILIEDLATLPLALAEKVRSALSTTTMIPRISRIVELTHAFGNQEWRVETDRGIAEFRVQEREDVRFLPDGRMAVKDADGNIYELPPEDQLDPASRRHLEFLI